MPSRNTSESFGLKLVLLARLYRRALDGALKIHGLTEATALPLRHLAGKTDGVRQGALADLLVLEGPTLVQMLDQLETRGLVERREDPRDKRAKLVMLTEAGKDVHARFMTTLVDFRDFLFEGSSEAEIKTALAVMNRMEARLRQPRSNGIEIDQPG